MEPQVRFCTSADGARIAYATLGEGPPLVMVSAWAGNLERDWKHPDGHTFLESLSRGRLYVTFDRRGVGASQGEVDDLSLEAQVADISTVVDHLGLEQFDLWGVLDGAAVSVAYAARHPERVSRLVLWAAYPCGVDIVRPGAARGLVELTRQNWSLARRAIAGVCFPSGPTDLQRWFYNSLREHASPEMAAKCVEFFASVDVRSYLPRVEVPTLVLHRRGDRDAPIAAGRAAAALMPDARFVALEGDIGHPMVGDVSYIETVIRFLDEGRGQPSAAQAPPAAGLVTILFTDIEGSTTLTQHLGDAKAQDLLRSHNTIVRDALKACGGSEIKHTGDGIMASFVSVSGALGCAIAIQRAVAALVREDPEMPLRVRIGLNAGEPVAENQDLFGTAVQLAARICAHAEPGQILVPTVVRELAAGKGFLLADLGKIALRGFEDPVRLYEVRWGEEA
jgi:class 3 adenylate cyclase/pimeloyl-ACP methyl ester carboxylesterase